ncbi:MAG: NAD(P)/FAD-dependent oxidoreductase [Chitinophagaceae bacterium]|nr:NAD(P)/FAD-dependent oxidoreductase [Chitinophagaceae bacterium]
MIKETTFDVIIIGGSSAGLSAAMALGRSLRKVLIIDSNSPCNRNTIHSHNLIAHDGDTPLAITTSAKHQVLKYRSVKFLTDLATEGTRTNTGFEIKVKSGAIYSSRKVLFTTGLIDIMADIKGFAECWGISVLHCPYCHGYEVKEEEIGLIANGDSGFELSRLIHHWSKKITLFTNGQSYLTAEQFSKIKKRNIKVDEREISMLDHYNGHIKSIKFKDGTEKHVSAVFSRVPFKQHCEIPQQMGCKITEQGFLEVDDFGKSSIPGLFAAGDNTSMFRALSIAIAAGTKAGAFINKELIDEDF